MRAGYAKGFTGLLDVCLVLSLDFMCVDSQPWVLSFFPEGGPCLVQYYQT